MTWATSGTAILTAAGRPTTAGAEKDWADECAAAVNSAITTRLNGYTVVAASDAEKELTRSALLDGLEYFRAKDARMGILSVGPDGEPVRVSVDILWSVPVIGRYAVPGVG